MARTDETPLDDAIPEVDRLEQEQQVDPWVRIDEQWPAPDGPDGNEADRLEQSQEVVGDPDEDYAPDGT